MTSINISFFLTIIGGFVLTRSLILNGIGCDTSFPDQEISYILSEDAACSSARQCAPTVFDLGGLNKNGAAITTVQECKDACQDVNYVCDAYKWSVWSSTDCYSTCRTSYVDSYRCQMFVEDNALDKGGWTLFTPRIATTDYEIELNLRVLSGKEAGMRFASHASSNPDVHAWAWVGINTDGLIKMGSQSRQWGSVTANIALDTDYTLKVHKKADDTWDVYLDGAFQWSSTGGAQKISANNFPDSYAGFYAWGSYARANSLKILFPSSADETVCSGYTLNSISRRCFGYYGTNYAALFDSVSDNINYDSGIITSTCQPTAAISTAVPTPMPATPPTMATPTTDGQRSAVASTDLPTSAPSPSPTDKPTTLHPTTSEPTTVATTTSDPTTSEPTTSDPTTSEPTTLEPTPGAPTTSEPTTVEPTTVEPTTNEPSTLLPTFAPTATTQLSQTHPKNLTNYTIDIEAQGLSSDRILVAVFVALNMSSVSYTTTSISTDDDDDGDGHVQMLICVADTVEQDKYVLQVTLREAIVEEYGSGYGTDDSQLRISVEKSEPAQAGIKGTKRFLDDVPLLVASSTAAAFLCCAIVVGVFYKRRKVQQMRNEKKSVCEQEPPPDDQVETPGSEFVMAVAASLNPVTDSPQMQARLPGYQEELWNGKPEGVRASVAISASDDGHAVCADGSDDNGDDFEGVDAMNQPTRRSTTAAVENGADVEYSDANQVRDTRKSTIPSDNRVPTLMM
eukprot:CAMPEP_0202699470 /NCGR_PEP_ID=MMETSP1385-20130828/12706_1 /ASSEMBLY_ACC=CAM_ASM_000861 /TAXON_ID=933848 /ORGANISM="Elphidium margaritaceum" /LENGTH=737 /DNA_ID=CAMNT_0049356431 /DNA_START=52 /DNA_END=2265 /DNA_ORIENTATION=-